MKKNTTTSETITQNIRVTARPAYQDDNSSPSEKKFLFSYNIEISNEGLIGMRLMSRYWRIIDANGDVTEVRGQGVLGETPSIAAGSKFEYSSFCMLKTDFGTIEGYYIMMREDGDLEKIAIDRFYLAANAEGSLIDRSSTF